MTSHRIAIALSQFLRSIVSHHSKFDYATRKESSPTRHERFTEEEDRGWWVFQRRCYSCHTHGAFQRPDSWNIGLRVQSEDLGVGALTGNPTDERSFKIPTLRNVELTAPYMHDGRFKTLEEVIDHYSDGPIPQPNVTRHLRSGGFQLSDEEMAGLLAFLRTLTDYSLINDPRFSDPFRYGDKEKEIIREPAPTRR